MASSPTSKPPQRSAARRSPLGLLAIAAVVAFAVFALVATVFVARLATRAIRDAGVEEGA